MRICIVVSVFWMSIFSLWYSFHVEKEVIILNSCEERVKACDKLTEKLSGSVIDLLEKECK